MQKRKIHKKSSQLFGAVVPIISLFLILLLIPFEIQAQVSSAEEMARKLADPLSDIHALINENDTFFFDASSGQKRGEFYNFKLTPVWAMQVEENGYSLISRVGVPINGRYRSVADHFGRIWGLGDIELQVYIAPKSDSAWKWGVGPQFSFKTHSQHQLRGMGNGFGVSCVIVGNLTSQTSLALSISNSLSFDGNHSIASIQPFLTYNFKSIPGLYVTYRQATIINWRAEGTKVNLPLGAGIGRTWALGDSGHGFDFNCSIYFFPIRQDGAPLWSLKLGIGFVLP